MTRYSDNIYSGFQGVTSATTSKSAVVLTKTHNFNAAGAAAGQTLSGTFPPNTQNLTAELFIIQKAASATVSNKITVSAGGTNLIVVDQFGSADGFAVATLAGVARFTVTASACANVPVPASTNNGGEIPYSVTFLPVSADATGKYRIVLNFNRADTNTLGITA